MKKQLSIVLLTSLLLSGCDSLNDYTSFKEYTEIVKNATEGQKDIFFFKIKYTKYITKNIPFNIIIIVWQLLLVIYLK